MGIPTLADLQASKSAVENNLADVARMVEELKDEARPDEAETTTCRKWVVIEHGAPDDTWELSVCAAGTHGCISYGWDGDEKHIVWSYGSWCDYVAHPMLVEGYRRLAYELAETLNA